LTQEGQDEVRRRCVAAVERGMSRVKAAAVFDVHPDTVARWILAYRAKGERALVSRRRGYPPGKYKVLSPAHQKTVRRIILTKTPKQAGYFGVLWTRAAMTDLVRRRFGVTITGGTATKYLASWGLSMRKPILEPYERNPAPVQRWLAETHPAILARAEAEGGRILWLHQSEIGSASRFAAAWPPTRSSAAAADTDARVRVTLMAVIFDGGAWTFAVYDGPLTADHYTDFLERVVRYYGVKVHLVAEQLPIHKTKAVKAWLAGHAEQIEQHFLPGHYSAERDAVQPPDGETGKARAARPARPARAAKSTTRPAPPPAP
jgi:transposase